KRTRAGQKDAKVQGLYSKGLNYMLSRRNDVAAVQFEKVLALRPNHSDSLLRLGSIYHKDGDYDEAIKLHQRAVLADPKNIEALFALSLDFEDARRTEDALQVLEDIMEMDSGNLRALSRIRDMHMRQGRFEKAEETEERILKLSLPEKDRKAEQDRLTGLRYETGKSLLEEGNLEKAKRLFSALVKSEPGFVPAYLGLGEVLLEEGENGEAGKLWEDAFRNTGSIIFLHRLEDLYLKLGTPSRIINIYKDALLRKPSDVELNFFLGKLYYRLEMVDDAFDVLTSIDASTKRMPDLHKLLGNLFYRRGKCESAVHEYKRALSFSDQLIVPYRCDNCEYFTTEWSGRCPKCGKWNTYGVDLDEYC
ncbi:MAG TPA: tetratricopeptide repeat protein, partial [Nitrospirota bacterium]